MGRGRGDSAITYGDETLKSGAKFKLKKLSTTFSLKDLEKLGTTKEAPEIPLGGGEKAGMGKQRHFGASSGTTVWKRRISLSRKKAVKKYFTNH